MPVTARLSRLFYDRLGEDIANELVEWFNAVDATYRADLKELNELNFARSGARLERRLAELEAKLDRRFGELELKIERVAAELHARIDRVALELNARIDRLAAETRAELGATEARMKATLEARLEKQTRWFVATGIVAWATLMVPIIGLWLR